jgi:hypothetical protein
MLAGQRRAEIGRQNRGVSKRLVQRSGDQGDGPHKVVGRQVVLVMLQPEMARRDPRVLHLVIAIGLEPDRERMSRFATQAREHAGHGRAVGSTAQEARRGGIARRATDASLDQLPELLHAAVEVAVVVFDEGWLPVRGALGSRD